MLPGARARRRAAEARGTSSACLSVHLPAAHPGPCACPSLRVCACLSMRRAERECARAQVTAVPQAPQAADRALVADVLRLLAKLQVGQGGCSEHSGAPAASCEDTGTGAADARAASVTAHADWLPPLAPQPAAAWWVLPSRARLSRPPVGSARRGREAGAAAARAVGAAELAVARAAGAAMPAAAEGPCSQAGSVVSEAAAGAVLPADRPQRWVVIISDDSGFSPALRLCARAGCRTVSVGDSWGAGNAFADARLSWHEVQGRTAV